MLIDAHAHLDDRDDLDLVIERMRAAGVGRVVLVGVWRAPGDFGNALALARSRPDLFSATIGFHPHEAAKQPEADWAVAEGLARDPHVVAVGENGLDFHYDLSPREAQEESFRRGLRLARTVGKPIVVHTRSADAETVRVLKEEGVPPAGGVIHCFTSDAGAARAYLDLGLYVSVAGIVTFKTAGAIREAVRIVPRDRLTVETDSPYLAPVPYRGKKNEPAWVGKVAEEVAQVWGTTAEEVARVTTENARRLFRLP